MSGRLPAVNSLNVRSRSATPAANNARPHPYANSRRHSPASSIHLLAESALATHPSVSSRPSNIYNGPGPNYDNISPTNSSATPSLASFGASSLPHDTLAQDVPTAPSMLPTRRSLARGQGNTDIDTQFPLLGMRPSSRTQDEVYLDSVPCYQTPPRNTSPHQPTRELEMLISKFHLDDQRQSIHEFTEMPLEHMLTVLFMQNLRLAARFDAVALEVSALQPRLSNIEDHTSAAWTPSKAQSKLARAIARHYLLKPVSTYTRVGNLTRKYIRNNADKMRLRIYREDMTARVTLNDYIDEQVSQLKSSFRKAIFASCRKKTSLRAFARNMLDNYHIPPVPIEVPLAVLGTLALLREIAEPLCNKANPKGGDTGFWKDVEARLLKLYEELECNNRLTDAKWIEWAREMVAKDVLNFAVGSNANAIRAMTRDELNALVGLSANDTPMDDDHGFQDPDENIHDPDDQLDGPTISEETEEPRNNGDYDGDIDVDALPADTTAAD
ncbi:hypothetical protein C2E23DRAFT_886156 [Lenzites betulinus]|nr:hypothetical protein C2E23DRAFT_886156 [Lenzites betulinus]